MKFPTLVILLLIVLLALPVNATVMDGHVVAKDVKAAKNIDAEGYYPAGVLYGIYLSAGA